MSVKLAVANPIACGGTLVYLRGLTESWRE